MGRGRTRSSSSSSIESSNQRDLSTDLSLGLGFTSVPRREQACDWQMMRGTVVEEENECNSSATFFVKVKMEGLPIGRKLDLMAHQGYFDLISTLDHMFNAKILWADEDEMLQSEKTHVLTYEDKEGDWMMVGDVPWEMFLCTVRRLKISKTYM